MQTLPQLVANLTPEQLGSDAGRELTRRLVRGNLEAWCRFVLKPREERPALHHKLVLRVLEEIARSETPRRVMLLMPPGAAKSTYTSVCFPPWYLNLHPRKLILACSYAYTLIEGFGRQCRDLVELYPEVLGYGLSKSVAAAGDWRNTLGGGYFCAGVGAGIAGHRADLAFIDDYLGSEEEAESETMRDKIYNWYRKDFVPRLKPQASRIIIANRRHEEDLVGRLLAEESDKWEVIKIPMLAEDDDPLGRQPGERLWPEWFTEEQVNEAKKDSQTWAGLYQQRPSPEDGDYFKKDTILTYRPNELPTDLRIYAASDWALRKGDRNDRTCHLFGGVDNQGRLWVLPDWFWTKCDTLEATNAMFDMEKRRHPVVWWHGRENITGAVGPFVYQKMREENVYIPIEELNESKDKQAKAQSIKARMSAKMVLFPSFAPGWDEVLSELLSFPNGKHDDFVDTLAKLGQGLAKMTPASIQPKQRSLEEVLNPRITCGWVARSHTRQMLAKNISGF